MGKGKGKSRLPRLPGGQLVEFKFELGQQVKDIVTGYVGHVTGRVEHLTGCNTYFVQREYKKGEKIEHGEHFDEPRLVATGKSLDLPTKQAKPKPGYDRNIKAGK